MLTQGKRTIPSADKAGEPAANHTKVACSMPLLVFSASVSTSHDASGTEVGAAW
jgi:hypothetical protein